MSGIMFLTYNLFTASVFIDDLDTKYTLALTFGTINSLFHLYALINDGVLLTKYINDLKSAVANGSNNNMNNEVNTTQDISMIEYIFRRTTTSLTNVIVFYRE